LATTSVEATRMCVDGVVQNTASTDQFH